MPVHDAVYVLADDPLQALVEQAIQTISTDIMITCGGVTMHLAAWQDPDHWSDDWDELGIEDVPGFVAAQLSSDLRGMSCYLPLT